MRIGCFLTTFWHDAADAKAKFDGPLGIHAWYANVTLLFQPSFTFLACGTWSDPDYNQLPIGVPVVNSGVPYTKPYDHYLWQYDACAYMAAMAYALNRRDWDLLVSIDNDALIGAVDFDALLKEFIQRSAVMLTPAWCGRPGGPFHAIKREGAVRWMHMRQRGNLIDGPASGATLLIEEELASIFKGRWWNPWPKIPTMRQDYGLPDARPAREPLDQNWPFVRMPDQSIIEEYRATETSKAKPVLP